MLARFLLFFKIVVNFKWPGLVVYRPAHEECIRPTLVQEYRSLVGMSQSMVMGGLSSAHTESESWVW